MPIDDDDVIRRILQEAKTIAVVGASIKPWRDSNRVMQFLMGQGYEVFPVNPKYSEVLRIPCVSGLFDLGKEIDIVDVFRRPDALEPVVDEAISIGAKTLWTQLGVVNEKARMKAEQAGLNVIMDRCIRVDHQRLIR